MIGLGGQHEPKYVIPVGVYSATHYSREFNMSHHIGRAKALLQAAAQGSGVTLNVKFRASDPCEVKNNYTVDADTEQKLNISTSGKTQLGMKFTTTGAQSVKKVRVLLKKAGTIAADKTLTLAIYADSSGPAGAALGTAGTILANGIGSAYEWAEFAFTIPVNLANGTPYWLVLSCNYDASDTNYIVWGGRTVGSGGLAATYAPTTWTAVTTLNLLHVNESYVFADVSGLAFGEIGNAPAEQEMHFDIRAMKQIVQAVATVAGGSATGASALTLLATKRFS